MAALSYVNVFTHDLDALPDFYKGVFGFAEVEAIRSPIFRGIDAGGCCIGFNAQDAYGLLGLGDHANPTGVSFLLNIDVDSAAEVDRLVPVAEAAGATLIKKPYKTYYDWYQAVLRDPEGNVFRINTVL
ncbi:VOC family protein [Beijerinckia sp. L45]|uniref:VOC family protein n=1 Tax=Beijerinckia sp. L45 TaxID=1641855 RepID=UPI00131E25A9|nr:VOC family protein [Beijerinckia sp. L45]